MVNLRLVGRKKIPFRVDKREDRGGLAYADEKAWPF